MTDTPPGSPPLPPAPSPGDAAHLTFDALQKAVAAHDRGQVGTFSIGGAIAALVHEVARLQEENRSHSAKLLGVERELAKLKAGSAG